ncbi:MAG: hypothetical protein Q4F81_11325 [Eubacteriales bacterium]|nr:hypothetical protein [Eubacteriales bacterium]
MKTVNTIVKLLSALAAVAGAVYIIATYGEQITAWAKKALSSLPKCPCCKEDSTEEEAPVEEPVAEEAAAEEPAAVEVPVEAPAAPAQEPVVASHEPVAEESDFAE